VFTFFTGTTDDTTVRTDNACAVLVTRCVQGKFGDWYVASVIPRLPEILKQDILNKAAEIGLDTSDYTIVPYLL